MGKPQSNRLSFGLKLAILGPERSSFGSRHPFAEETAFGLLSSPQFGKAHATDAGIAFSLVIVRAGDCSVENQGESLMKMCLNGTGFAYPFFGKQKILSTQRIKESISSMSQEHPTIDRLEATLKGADKPMGKKYPQFTAAFVFLTYPLAIIGVILLALLAYVFVGA